MCCVIFAQVPEGTSLQDPVSPTTGLSEGHANTLISSRSPPGVTSMAAGAPASQSLSPSSGTSSAGGNAEDLSQSGWTREPTFADQMPSGMGAPSAHAHATGAAAAPLLPSSIADSLGLDSPHTPGRHCSSAALQAGFVPSADSVVLQPPSPLPFESLGQSPQPSVAGSSILPYTPHAGPIASPLAQHGMPALVQPHLQRRSFQQSHSPYSRRMGSTGRRSLDTATPDRALPLWHGMLHAAGSVPEDAEMCMGVDAMAAPAVSPADAAPGTDMLDVGRAARHADSSIYAAASLLACAADGQAACQETLSNAHQRRSTGHERGVSYTGSFGSYLSDGSLAVGTTADGIGCFATSVARNSSYGLHGTAEASPQRVMLQTGSGMCNMQANVHGHCIVHALMLNIPVCSCAWPGLCYRHAHQAEIAACIPYPLP